MILPSLPVHVRVDHVSSNVPRFGSLFYGMHFLPNRPMNAANSVCLSSQPIAINTHGIGVIQQGVRVILFLNISIRRSPTIRRWQKTYSNSVVCSNRTGTISLRDDSDMNKTYFDVFSILLTCAMVFPPHSNGFWCHRRTETCARCTISMRPENYWNESGQHGKWARARTYSVVGWQFEPVSITQMWNGAR